MLVFGWGSRAIPAIFVAVVAASSASAATVELTSVTGSFQNPLWNVDFHGISDQTYDQLGANSGKTYIRDDVAGQLWWGNPRPVDINNEPQPWNNFNALAVGDPLLSMQSGYVFSSDGIGPFDIPSSTGLSFVFGEFTHYNGAVWDNSATLASVDFWVDIKGKVVDGDKSETFTLSTKFPLVHNETLNPATQCAAGGNQPCRDSVTVEGVLDDSRSFVVGNVEYTFVLEGFVDPIDGTFVTSFFTDETEQSSAMLRASITSTPLPPPVVPLPATAWLMIAGIGGLAAVARKRRRAA